MNTSIKSSSGPDTTIVWFRRDFRLANNPALNSAISGGGKIIAIYIDSQSSKQDWQPGAASRWWCYHSLQRLSEELAQQNIRLRFFQGDPLILIPEIVRETGANQINWNRLYEPEQLKLEQKIEKRLNQISVQKFDCHLLFTPGKILNQQGETYRVFTPFWKKARVMLEIDGVKLTNIKRNKNTSGLRKKLTSECSLDELNLLDSNNWHRKLHNYWQPGETQARKLLRKLLNDTIKNYEITRDLPSRTGTSRISPYLHFGEITPAQIVYAILKREWSASDQVSVERFLAELGWREFAHHILWSFPHTPEQAMNERFLNFWPDKADKKRLVAWQTGQTGVPIIDAGMRELWETGWMHNRVRMIVASFLTKNLGIHWKHGAKWFWDTLVDADLANNSMGWQWVAGCGVDAAPYYRIFNPYTQADKFDKDGKYVQKWVPESNEPGYAPMVDIKMTRQQALEKYKSEM